MKSKFLALLLILPTFACATEGGRTDFWAWERICRLQLSRPDGFVVAVASAILVSRERLLTARQPIPAAAIEATRLEIICPKGSITLPWDPVRGAQLSENPLNYIDLPELLPENLNALRMTSPAKYQSVFADAETIYAAGAGGRRTPSDTEILDAVGRIAPNEVATAVGRDFMLKKIRSLLRSEQAPQEYIDQHFGEIFRIEGLHAAIDRLQLQGLPGAVDLFPGFFSGRRNRFRLKSPVSVLTASDRGGAVVVHTKSGEEYLVGIISNTQMKLWASSSDPLHRLGETIRKELHIPLWVEMTPVTNDLYIPILSFKDCGRSFEN